MITITKAQIEKFLIWIVPALFLAIFLFLGGFGVSNMRNYFESRLENEAEYSIETRENIDKVSFDIKSEGEGNYQLKTGDSVRMNYRGWRANDGFIFDSSFDDGGSAIVFVIGNAGVIKGLEEGVIGMKQGEVRRVFIPSELGYGESGAGTDIPANTDIIFDVELVEIINKAQ